MRVQKMANGKVVDLQRIANDKTRMTTYKKRKACLYKKAGEFSTLCGVQTCLIVYGPTKATDEVISKPEIWPEDESKAREIIHRYRDTASNSCRKEAHVETFVNDKGKANETENHINKRGMNNKNKYSCWEEKLDKCSQEQLRGIYEDVGKKLHEAIMRQNRSNAVRAQHQAMEPQFPQFLMDQHYMSQCFAGHQQQQCLMFPYNNMSFPLFPPHDDQIPMEPILVDNLADSGVNQGFMMSKESDGTQFMQRQAPYYNLGPVAQRSASFNVNPFPGYQVPYNIPRLPGNQGEGWDFMAKKPI
ncbi:Agamous-like MADS-box protein AGL82 [Hirschfeldia incana]|nr:Agamous-like MADS-box protein AGL82 [Hirschfeldia incana]